MKLGKTIGFSLALLASSASHAQEQTFTTNNQVSRCVLQLLDGGATEFDARTMCGLSPDLEVRRLPGGEICILPKTEKLVTNMTEIPDDNESDEEESEESERKETEKPEDSGSLPIS